MIIKIDDMVTYRSLENKKSSGDPDANTEINLLACKLYDNDEIILEGTYYECVTYIHQQFENQLIAHNLSS